jgi:hypothetical protein
MSKEFLEARETINSFSSKAEQFGSAVALISDVVQSVQCFANSTISQFQDGCIHIKHTDPSPAKKNAKWLYTSAKCNIKV